MKTDDISCRRAALRGPALALAALTLAGALSGCGSSATAQAPTVVAETMAAPTGSVTAPASPTSTPSSAPSASASAKVVPPDPDMSEEWRSKAKTIKAMGASGVSEYADTSDGAVIAFEDFFNLLAWELAGTYNSEEDDAITDAEKDASIDRQLFRTMKMVDRESMGREKVNDILDDYSLASYVLGESDVKVVASRQGITKASDGTVTISDANLFYLDEGKMTQFGDGRGPFTLEYRSNTKTWVVIDRNSDS